MNELKAFNCVESDLQEFCELRLVYLKSEADKVIAEKDKQINELRTELELWRDGSIISEAHQKELDGKRHSDYKRCLAMAKLCQWKMGVFIYKKEKNEFYYRWHKRWLKIAEQFKEAK